jgi:hypothetical protein
VVEQNGEDWFNEQSEDKQRELMGREFFDAWKGGQFSFSDLATKREDAVYGQMTTATPLKDLISKVDESILPVPYNVEESPIDWVVKNQLSDADLPISHTDGLGSIAFNEDDLIRGRFTTDITGAYGMYDPRSKVITLASNADNVHVIGAETVIHEIGHHVHLSRITDDAATIWADISKNGTRALISNYAKSNQGEHFAEAYRAYARGDRYRKTLKNLEADSYRFMTILFRSNSKYLLPEGSEIGLDQFWIRYDPSR